LILLCCKGGKNKSEFDRRLTEIAHQHPSYPYFAKQLVTVKQELLEIDETQREDWFDQGKEYLIPLIQARNNALARYISTKKLCYRSTLQDTRRHLKRAKRRAKR
jgi:hypothetical protein